MGSKPRASTNGRPSGSSSISTVRRCTPTMRTCLSARSYNSAPIPAFRRSGRTPSQNRPTAPGSSHLRAEVAKPTTSPFSSASHERRCARSGSERSRWTRWAAVTRMPGCIGRTSSAAAGASAASNGRISMKPYWPTMASAAVVTIGNELLSGDVENTNGSWLARRLEAAGVDVRLIAVVPDEVEEIATTLREQADRADLVVVTGGLGGTPDDVTREALAAAFGLEQIEYEEVGTDLRTRFRADPEYAARWAQLPAGSRPLANPLGGAPGFLLENVYVLPGLPAEMEAMFDTVADELRRPQPIATWRRTYATRESEIVAVLAEA